MPSGESDALFYTLTLKVLRTTVVVFDLFYQQVKSQLLEIKWVFKHQDLQMFGRKLNKYE